MIEVVASSAARPWVREFFEHFKTPWRFYEAGDSPEVLVFCDGGVEIPDTQARLVLIFGTAAHALSSCVVLECGPDKIPIYGRCGSFPAGVGGELAIDGTKQTAATVQTVGGRMVVRAGYDLFEEVRWLLTHGQPPEHAVIPTLDLHVSVVRDWLVRSGYKFVEIPPVPAGYRHAVCLTHDMDHPAIRFHGLDHTAIGFLVRATLGSLGRLLSGQLSVAQLLNNWVAAMKWPLVQLGWAKDFWRQTGRYLEIEHGLGSTFFVIPERGNPGRGVDREHAIRRAAAYGAADITDDLRQIEAAGHEVGVHGIDAWLDADNGRAEGSKVAQASGRPARGIRMHWLCFNEQSPAVLEAAGYDYDSTVGYNQCVGYRAGTLQVYRPAGAERLLELPLHIMDTALFYTGYLNLTRQKALALVRVLQDHARQFGGVLTMNWHDRSLAPERQWDKVYAEMLTHMQEGRAWFAKAADVVAWFRQRRATTFEPTAGPDGGRTICVKVARSQPTLPGLILRCHNFAAQPNTSTDIHLQDVRDRVVEVVGGITVATP